MIDVRSGSQVADWGLPCLQPPQGSFTAKPLRSVHEPAQWFACFVLIERMPIGLQIKATVVSVGGESEGKPWVAVGDSGGGMCVLDARMGLVLYRWKVNSEAGVTRAETVPGLPHILLTAAERTLTGKPHVTCHVALARDHITHLNASHIPQCGISPAMRQSPCAPFSRTARRSPLWLRTRPTSPSQLRGIGWWRLRSRRTTERPMTLR